MQIGFNNTTVTVLLDTEFIVSMLTGLEQERPVVQIALEIVVMLLMWIFSVLGNTLVCIVIYRSRRVQSTTNYFVVSLAMSDLLLSFVCVPIIASRVLSNRWVACDVMCRLVRFIEWYSPTISICVLICITIDRFYSIIYPLSFKITRGTAKRMTLFCWLFSIILCSFFCYFYRTFKSVDGSGKELCPTYVSNKEWSGVTFAVFVILVSYVIPLLCVTVAYCRIFNYVWATGIGRRGLRRTTNPVSRTKVKMVKMIITVTAGTLACYMPFYAVQLWYSLSSVTYVSPTVYIFVFWTLYSSTVFKPLVYMIYNSNFRRGCREVFCMSNMKCYRSNTYAITTASPFGKKNHVGVMTSENGYASLNTTSLNGNVISEKYLWPVATSVTSSTYI